MVGDTWIPDASDPCLTCTCHIIPEDASGMKGVTMCDRSACNNEEGKTVLSPDARKPVFGVSDKVRHKPGCTATEDN